MIEISRDMQWVYRINPYNPRIVDKRPNRRGGRWQHYDYYSTPEDALIHLFELERPDPSPGAAALPGVTP